MPKYRLYLYGSHDGGKTYVYDTGVFNSDAPSGQGCLNPDAQQLPSLQAVIAYANAHGEALQEVHSVEEVNRICSGALTAPAPIIKPVVPLMTPVDIGVTQSGILTPLQLTPSQNSTVAAAVSPSGTPGGPGSVPTGASVGQTTPQPVNTLYRFILVGANGNADSGANYSGCSSVNSMMCDPRQFASLADAIDYSEAHHEIPYRVLSASEPWGIINGTIPVDNSQLLGSYASSSIGFGTLALAGIALYLLLHRS